MLAKRFISSKSRGDFNRDQLKQSRIEKTSVSKSLKISNIACWFAEKTKFQNEN